MYDLKHIPQGLLEAPGRVKIVGGRAIIIKDGHRAVYRDSLLGLTKFLSRSPGPWVLPDILSVAHRSHTVNVTNPA